MPKATLSIDSFVRSISRKTLQDGVRRAEDERLRLLKKFPKDKWAELSLERYAYGPGNSEETFSSLMENDTNTVTPFESHGSREFKIYFSELEQRWWYIGNFKNEQKAWSSIRESYLRGFAIAESGRWNQVHKVNSGRYGNKALLKTLICYFPDELLPIALRKDIALFLRKIGVVDFEDSAQNVVNLNRLLLLRLRQKAFVDDWKPAELKGLLYAWAQPKVPETE